jgi:hypothetical protein
MTKSKLESLSNDELVRLFEKAARDQGKAVLYLDARKATAAYHRRAAAFDQLSLGGPEAQLLLVPLLDHADPAVRLYTAKRLLRGVAPAQARTTLEELTKHPQISFAGDAGMSLDIFDKKI